MDLIGRSIGKASRRAALQGDQGHGLPFPAVGGLLWDARTIDATAQLAGLQSLA
jgi:hypothetical protein